MEIECKIMGIEAAFTKNGKQFWKVKTDKGNMNVFDGDVVENIQPFINGMCTLTVEEKGTFKNIKGIVDNAPVRTEPALFDKTIARTQLNTTTMYTSYAKDVFIALCEKTINPQQPLDYATVMGQAIALVEQAKESFS